MAHQCHLVLKFRFKTKVFWLNQEKGKNTLVSDISLKCYHWFNFHLQNEIHCVKSVHVRSYSGSYSVQTRENKDQNNPKFGHFLRSDSSVVRNYIDDSNWSWSQWANMQYTYWTISQKVRTIRQWNLVG